MNISTRQWEIDAADASANVIFKSKVKIKNIAFTDYAADTDAFVIEDINGAVIWSGNGEVGLGPVMSQHIGWTDGLVVPTLDSGRLIIYTE